LASLLAWQAIIRVYLWRAASICLLTGLHANGRANEISTVPYDVQAQDDYHSLPTHVVANTFLDPNQAVLDELSVMQRAKKLALWGRKP
jgi:hypothetical protein